MEVSELQAKYKKLKESLESAKLNKAKAQANFESAEREKEELKNSLLTSTDSKTVEEAKDKFSNLSKKLEAMIAEAEELLK